MRQANRVEYSTSVGGAVFGEDLVRALRGLGVAAELNYLIPLSSFWARKSKRNTLGLRIQMYVVYPLLLAAQALWRSRRTYIVTTNPFFAPLLVALVAKLRGHLVIQHLLDLYPEGLICGGGLNPCGLLARCLRRLTRWSLRLCHATVFLGERLRAHADETYGRARLGVCIPVGSEGSPFANGRPSEPEPGGVTLLYSGHFGRMHDVVTLAGVLNQPPPPNCAGRGLRLVLNADGPGVRRLRTCLDQGRTGSPWVKVEFGRTQPQGDWVRAMKAAQVAVVTLAPGAEHAAMPSKTYSALLAGQAILAVCVPESDLSDLVLRHDCGWVIHPGDSAALSRALAEICDQPLELLRKRQNAYDAGHQHFATEVVVRQWDLLLNQLGGA
jgi:glycosyltransferase involved in cell wall biosynthesis